VKAIEFRQTRKALLAAMQRGLHLAECLCGGLEHCFESRRVGECRVRLFSTGRPSIESRWHAKRTEIGSIAEIGAERISE
jgi:hypothetical protein